MKVVKFLSFFAALLGLVVAAMPAFTQSITSGDVAGVVSDPSGAVVPNAKVTAKNDATAASQTTSTNGEGFYRFAFLQPGGYTLTVEATNFQTTTRKLQVQVGQTANGNVTLAVTAQTTIEVTAPAVQIETPDVSTAFTAEQVALVPNPGNDLSAVAQTAPGVVMNTQSGFGNFSTFGLPGTSNLFTINGMNDNDPFLNLNNSGATNLLLGANDIQEVTVVNNAYSGQYGQLAGSQINYVTKAGGNAWHGNAIYYWNGRVLNANDYVNNLQVAGAPSTPKPFDNVNQWAAGFSGPIQKDKTFFSFNYEGLRVVLPTTALVFVPTPAFESATIANLNANGLSASVPFYQTMFNLWNNAAAGKAVTPKPLQAGENGPGCDNVTALPAGVPCVNQFRTTPTNFTHEYQMSLRIDHNFSDNDKVYGRVQTDRGVQATFTDAINPLFNTQSTQPEYQGQLNWTHVFSPNLVNELKPSGTWYTAIFQPANLGATLAAFPTTVTFGDGSLSTLGGEDFIFPQGRNVTQYQVVDDLVWTKGNHTLKFGANFRRYDVTDFDYGLFTSGLAIVPTLDDFFFGGFDPASGNADVLLQNFLSRQSQPMALYGLGLYAQDEWRIAKRLKLTLSLRGDHNSNPVCQTNCFAELAQPFTSITNHDPSVPYNQLIKTGLHQAYPSTDTVVWQPRFGFNWSPFSNNKTVFSGGIGIFTDSFPAVLVDSFSSNPPIVNPFVTFFLPLSPQETNGSNLFAAAASSNASFNSAFKSGASFADLTNPSSPFFNPFFAPPSITASDKSIRQPRYQEWNLMLQQELGWNTVLALNYVGNHGIFEAIQNNALNAFAPGGFGTLPTAPPDPRFGTVNQVQSIGVSNYNGLTTSLRHQFNHGLAFQANYTWSHAFDEVSNGGLLQFNLGTASSLLHPQDPFNLRAGYGPADYDVRHYFSANYVWDNSLRHLFHWGPNAIFGGWTFSGTVFSRSGLPFTVINSAATNALAATNYGSTVYANVIGPTTATTGCGKAAATPNPTTGIAPPCLLASGFADAASQAAFGNQGRNSFRGPDYFDTDFTVMKYIKIGERGNLGFGFQFFNLLNHPNFDQPVNDINSPLFGTIQRTVNTPTSILGSFLGGDASPRLIQLKAEFKF
jgi:outer membrane receptor protein involved in Fe transport